MKTLTYDTQKTYGKFKILNATNGGPWHKRHAPDQFSSNFEDYKALQLPYTRNHDANAYAIYGGPFGNDITGIFPNFDADADDPASYDFACTDESIMVSLDAGTETYFRLGQTIEHQIKKHNTLPPKDFEKWAEICEHIIRHYNEGWADGFHLNITYWEIWNEPDLDPDDSKNKRTWGGTEKQFYDLYSITAKRLKARFPHLKIGGPALAWNEDWADRFLCEMKKREVPIDFFSWHFYGCEPRQMSEKAERIHAIMDKNGYGDAESILDEWNYIKNWKDKFVYSVESMGGIKGATFMLGIMSEAQKEPVDMLMFYSTIPHSFCNVFEPFTCYRRKGYWSMLWSGMLRLGDYEEIRPNEKIERLYTLCGVNKDGKKMAVLTYYYDETDDLEDLELHIDFGTDGEYEIYLLDEAHDGTLVQTTKDLTVTMKQNTAVMIRQK